MVRTLARVILQREHSPLHTGPVKCDRPFVLDGAQCYPAFRQSCSLTVRSVVADAMQKATALFSLFVFAVVAVQAANLFISLDTTQKHYPFQDSDGRQRIFHGFNVALSVVLLLACGTPAQCRRSGCLQGPAMDPRDRPF